LSLYMASGNNVPCDPGDIQQLPAIYPAIPIEVAANRATRELDAALTAAHISHTAEFPDCGVHTFKYFQDDLHHFWPQMLAAFGTGPPPSVDYRRADPSFSVWGWK